MLHIIRVLVAKFSRQGPLRAACCECCSCVVPVQGWYYALHPLAQFPKAMLRCCCRPCEDYSRLSGMTC